MSLESKALRERVPVPLIICLFVVGLVSCAAKIDPVIRQRAREIPVLTASEIKGRHYELLSEVEGKDCARYPMDEHSTWIDQQDAYDEGMGRAAWKMKVAAVELGADAIIDVLCVPKTGWPSMDCGMFKTECQGHAIRWRAEEESGLAAHPTVP